MCRSLTRIGDERPAGDAMGDVRPRGDPKGLCSGDALRDLAYTAIDCQHMQSSVIDKKIAICLRLGEFDASHHSLSKIT